MDEPRPEMGDPQTMLGESEASRPFVGHPELAFVLAPAQDSSSVGLAEALCAEALNAGARASLHVGNFPPPRLDLIYVMVGPRDYFTLMHGRVGPPPEALRRTVFVFSDPPESSVFDENVGLAPRAGAAYVINRPSVAAFARHGIAVEHLQLGWTRHWDPPPARERDIDVLFIGRFSDRRATALAGFAHTLWRRRVCYLLTEHPPSPQEQLRTGWTLTESRPTDAERLGLLSRARVLISIREQQGTSQLDWLHIAQAMANGAVVVSEAASDFEPLVPGKHLLLGDLESLGLLAVLALDDDERRHALATVAQRFLREELPLRPGVDALLLRAGELARSETVPAANDEFFTQPQPGSGGPPLLSEPMQAASSAPGDANVATLRRAVKSVLLEMKELRRQAAYTQLLLANGHPPPRLEIVRRSRAHDAAHPRVSVLTALYDYEDQVLDALESLRRSEIDSWEAIVVDDGSNDRSAERVERWIAEHDDVAAVLLRHPINQGLGPTRNDALGWARGEFCFVLDADNEIYPHCFGRLIEALEADPAAAFAYGILERFRGGEPIGLLNMLPWEPSRLRLGNYIDAMALIRTRILRDECDGYARDLRLYGAEDFDLWCRLAEGGHHAAFVPEIVARYRTTQHSMQALGTLSDTDGFSLVIERSPILMAGVLPPA
jgi:Glycosyl transferase family 2